MNRERRRRRGINERIEAEKWKKYFMEQLGDRRKGDSGEKGERQREDRKRNRQGRIQESDKEDKGREGGERGWNSRRSMEGKR